MRTAFVTGIAGQDGSYLAEWLLAQGYAVHGMVRHELNEEEQGILHLFDGLGPPAHLVLHRGDLRDGERLAELLASIGPDEVYNLGAQSHVGRSFDEPLETAEVVALGALRLLEAVRTAGLVGRVRYYQASSSEMFGLAAESPQSERTPFHPRSPYACAKVFAHHQTVNYREAYGLHASCGILFNHESPRRGRDFVTRKVTRGVAAILAGETDSLSLGNLDARRDWGFAGDYVEAMWRMLQQDSPDDYVIATGVTHSVRDFLERAFGLVGLDWRDHVRVDERHLRPSDVAALVGDAAKARERLGWAPRTGFEALVRQMLRADLEPYGLAGRVSPEAAG